MGIDEVSKKFVLTQKQAKQFSLLMPFYLEWNARVNVISRKDISNLYVHHVLHSLSILKFLSPKTGDKIVDLGTGGGFPGIPLSIMLPEVQFLLVDSIKKKIRVTEALSRDLQLTNVETLACRIEDISNQKFNYAVSRAVGNTTNILDWSSDLIKVGSSTTHNGHILLKGGDLEEDINFLKKKNFSYKITPISQYFEHAYFRNKFILYIPVFQGKEK